MAAGARPDAALTFGPFGSVMSFTPLVFAIGKGRWAAVQREREGEERDDEDPEHSSGPDRDLETTFSSIRLWFKAFQALMNIRDVTPHRHAATSGLLFKSEMTSSPTHE